MRTTFNPLLDALPEEFDGARVRTDYRQALKFFRIVEAKELDETEKSMAILAALFERLPRHSDDLWDFITWYINGGGEQSGEAGGKRLFDFEVDSGRVYAAFLQIYGINLRSAEMHWFLFLQLFQALPEGTHLSRVIEIRGKTVDSKTDKKTAAAIRRMKRAYALESGTERQDFKGFLRR